MAIALTREIGSRAAAEESLAAVRAFVFEVCHPSPQWDPDAQLERAFHDHFESFGGQKRAWLTLSAGRRLGIADADAVALAASVELLHNASLVQDDMQDQSLTRRGRTAVWGRYGEPSAIGLTNLLLASAFAAVARIRHPDVLPTLIEKLYAAVAETAEGQVADLARPSDLAAVVASARRKSGPFFALALELPLVTAGYLDDVALAHGAACDFGLGYQIFDDLADVETDRAAETGSSLVLAFEREFSPTEARSRVVALAWEALGSAIERARRLPRDCGMELAEQAEDLSERLALHRG